jgi:hypothetical protein
MAKALTAAGIARYKPSKQRREIRDGAATGLYLILQESGQRSFALRFRKPNGKPAKLTLGPVDVSGVEQDGTPVLGAPLTLAGARSRIRDPSPARPGSRRYRRPRRLQASAPHRARRKRGKRLWSLGPPVHRRTCEATDAALARVRSTFGPALSDGR